ncbi:MAG TPA: hypothetical protein VEW07_10120 [Solirubrobacterales bacterium]|nr:hypothetical protein [Solirubrobacterales bacterium]
MRLRLLGLTLVLLILGSSSALAKDGDIEVAGSCTGASSAKLDLSEEDGGIEVEFEVDQNRAGVRWNATLKRNGAPVVSAHPTTRGPSGSFELRRVLVDGPAAEVINAKAVSPSGEICRARATFP